MMQSHQYKTHSSIKSTSYKQRREFSFKDGNTMNEETVLIMRQSPFKWYYVNNSNNSAPTIHYFSRGVIVVIVI